MYRHSPLMRSLLSQFQTQLPLAESSVFSGLVTLRVAPHG
jgi:hypothetical protein